MLKQKFFLFAAARTMDHPADLPTEILQMGDQEAMEAQDTHSSSTHASRSSQRSHHHTSGRHDPQSKSAHPGNKSCWVSGKQALPGKLVCGQCLLEATRGKEKDVLDRKIDLDLKKKPIKQGGERANQQWL